MPYRSLGEPDLDFSVEQAAFIGLFTGTVVLVSEVAAGGILGLLVFAVVMSVLFRDLRVVLSWVVVAVLTMVYIGLALVLRGFTGGLISLTPILILNYLILLLPGLGEQDVIEFVSILTAGGIGAVVVGLMLSSPETIEQGFWVFEVFFMGFPVFGGAYAAALTNLYEDGEGEG